MQIDPKRTAILLIEFQNDFASEGGTLHDAVKGVMASNNMLQNTVELVRDARDLGITVIHAPISFKSGYTELNDTPYGILKGVVDTQSFVKDTWGAEIVPALHPQADDIIAEGKRGLCVFSSTNLDFILRSKGIETLAVAGFLTNCCVESTLRSGYEKGFNVIGLTDCTAATSEIEQQVAIEKNYPMFSRPMTKNDFLDTARGSDKAVSAGRGYAS